MSVQGHTPKVKVRHTSRTSRVEVEIPSMAQTTDGHADAEKMRKGMEDAEGDSGNNSLDVNSDETRSIPGDIESNPDQEPEWDRFKEMEPDQELYSNQKCIDICHKLMKIIMMVILFSVNLGAMIVNKGSILFITSHVNQHVVFKHEDPEGGGTCGAATCADKEQCEFRQSVRWIWSLYLCMVTPYVFGLIRSLWKISFKLKKVPTKGTMLVVLLMESFHTIGLCMLLFFVMPNLDVSRALFLTTAVGFLPGVLRLFRHNENWLFLAFDVLAVLCQLSAFIAWPTEVGVNPTYFNGTETSGIGDVCTAPHLYYSEFVEFGAGNDSGFPRSTYSPPDMQTDPGFDPIDSSSTPLPESIAELWTLPIALLFISFVWWGNFVDQKSKLWDWFPTLKELRQEMHSSRTKTYAIISLWKIVLTFVFIMVAYRDDFSALFDSANFHQNVLGCDEDVSGAFLDDWLEVYAVQTIPPLLCFYCADLAVKANIQVESFSVPILLATPITYGLLLFACFECGMWNLGTDLYWNCFHGYGDYGELMVDRLVFMGFLWWISQLWITRHIWTPKIEKLAKSDRIFVLPIYCGPLLDQGLAFNRRVKDRELFLKPKARQAEIEEAVANDPELDPLFKRTEDDIPMIYMCATMWHETKEEMIQILKSIFRMDFDQKARKIVKEHLGIYDPDYYDVETNFFFDDAFEKHDADEDFNFSVNIFVKQLIEVLDEAASAFHEVDMKLPPPERYLTPYGGRLVWTLPGDTKLVVHLKDKVKIRHRKRWSQVMYMYYLFGHRLMSQNIDNNRKQTVSENTFILALDGDVDFKPEAVIHLLDLMKRNNQVGAACGRIHPVGSGFMIWYQKFEYALGHWLQKATEHVLGCVLCSPGCFSLFRACALMDDNVMKTYTKKPVTAKDHVQYDQGEDRWLCTLLLQQGYRVEYAAASDAMTVAPEGFNEFFNQRKRWTPSTFANIMDLLSSGRETVKKNQNISMLYMAYQGGLFASSILGPGTIFLLIVGAFNSAFGFNTIGGFLLVFIPVLIFLILCMKAKQATQLYVAAILAAVFAVVQMVVLAGVIIEMVEYGLCSLSTIFTLFIVGEFLLGAILHPQEFFNILYGPIYYLCIPTMYLLLIIYSLCNLNDINWGTREVVPTAVAKEKEEQKQNEKEKKEMEAKKDDPSSWMNMLKFGSDGDSKTGAQACGCGSLFQCMCCLRPGESPEEAKLTAIQKQLTVMRHYLLRLIRSSDSDEAKDAIKNEILTDDESEDDNADENTPLIVITDSDPKPATEPATLTPGAALASASVPQEVQNAAPEPPAPKEQEPKPDTVWIEDPDLGRGARSVLVEKESSFWSKMIAEYLEPLEMSPAAKKDMAEGLSELRNTAVFAFFIIDALVICLVIVLQVSVENGTDHRLSWNCTGSTDDGEIKLYYIDPIALMFLIVFGSFMVIQLFGMIFHRVFSFMQIVSSTNLRQPKHLRGADNKKTMSPMHAKMIVANMMRLKGADAEDDDMDPIPTIHVQQSPTNPNYDDDDAPDDNVPTGQLPVVDKLATTRHKSQKTINLEQSFSYRYTAYATLAQNVKKRPDLPPEMRKKAEEHELEQALQRARKQKTLRGTHDVILKYRDELFKDDKVQELETHYPQTMRQKNKHMMEYINEINTSQGGYAVDESKLPDFTAGYNTAVNRRAPSPPSRKRSDDYFQSGSGILTPSPSTLTLMTLVEEDGRKNSATYHTFSKNPIYQPAEDPIQEPLEDYGDEEDRL